MGTVDAVLASDCSREKVWVERSAGARTGALEDMEIQDGEQLAVDA